MDAAWLQDWAGGTQLSGVDFHRNMLPALDLSGRYATDVFTEEAVTIIEQHDTSSPLFLYLAHLACHAGNMGKLLEAPKDAVDKFDHIMEPNRKTYAGKGKKFPHLDHRLYSYFPLRFHERNAVVELVAPKLRFLEIPCPSLSSGSSCLDRDLSWFSLFPQETVEMHVRFKTSGMLRRTDR